MWLTRLAGALLFVLLSLWSHQASAASTCPSPRAVSIVAGGEYYEDYTNAPCSQFGLTGTLVAPLHGTLEDSNATNAVRYRNTNLSATSDTFTVRDDVGQPIVYNVTITSAIVLAPATVPNATVAQPYSTTTLTATGGAAPYTYAVSAGALPAGMSLSGGGVLSGTPTAGGTFNFTVRATDSLAVNGTRAYTLTVAAPTIAIAPTTLPAMTAGVAYTETIAASGGTGTYTYARTAGSLPAGLTLASNGTLSGTPTAAGAYSFTVTATDSSTGAGPYSGARAYSGTVAAGAPVAGDVSATVAYGSSANPITLNLSGGAATSVAVASAASNGTATASGTSITYTPTAGYGGTDSFTYTASNGIGTSTPATVTITVSGPTITLAPSTVPVASVGTAYSQSVTAANGGAPYTYAISAGALPAGLSLNTSTGLLSGTPMAGGTFNFTVRATDSSTGSGPYSGARAYSMTVAAPTISIAPATLPAMTAGLAYSQGITAANGTASYTYAVTAGSVPAGLTLAANGTLSGTPTTAGAYSFTVTATDSSGGAGPYTGARAYSGTVANVAPIAGAVNATVAYGSSAQPITLNLSGGVATSVAVASAASHGTTTVNGTSISYTPATGYAGSDSFSYTASNGAGTSAQGIVTITVSPPVITLAPTGLQAMTFGVAYSETITASGGASPYGYVSSGSLPAGLSLAPNGTLSGTPTAAGAYSFTITATDSSTGTSAPFTGARTYSGTVANVVPIAGAVNATVAYGSSAQPITLNLSGGVATSVAVASAASHGTTTVNGTSISYTPAAGYAGTDSFSYTASNGAGTSAQAIVTLTVGIPNISLTPATLPNATAEAAYSAPLAVTGGTAPYTFSISSGGLPAGLTLNASTGVVSGTTNVAGSFPVSIKVTDSSTGAGAPFSATNSYTLSVAAPTITVTPTTLSAPKVATAYSQQLTASGGVGPYAYTVSGGSLPAGLTLNGSGLLSGTPTAGGSFTLTVQAADAHQFTGTQSYTLVVSSATVSLTPATLPNATAEAAYTATLTAAGGTAPYTYSVASGTLPAGLTLNASTGVLSGTTNVAGSFPVSIKVTDSSTGAGAPFSATNSYTLSVAAPTIAVTPATLPAPKVATAYSQQLSASGGVAPYAYTVSNGSLPAGLTLNGSGLLSGTPTAGGSFTLTMQATDAHQFTGTQSYTLVVSSATVSLTPATLPNATAEAAYTATLTAAGGTAPYTYSVAGGTLPAGLTLNASTGVLSGTTNVAGSFAVSIKVTDSSTGAGAPFSATNSYTLSVAAPAITVTPSTLPAPKVATAYSQQLAASGGIAPYAYTVSSGNLPAGLTLNSSGLLSGTPTAAGSFTLTAQAADAHQFTGTQSYTLVVSSATVSLTPATLPNPTAEAVYTTTLTAAGGTAPYTFSVSSGTLPAGLSLNAATGVLSGTTNVAGSFPFSIKVTDSSTGAGAPFSATNSYTLSVGAPTITVTPATLPAATAATAYSQQLTANGGVAPYAYTVSSGSLPAGLTLSGSGLLSGTPTAAGSFTLTVQAEDAHQFTGTQSYTLTVTSATVSLTPASLPNPTAEAAYSTTLTATGGTAPYSYAVVGTLPAGLSLNTTTGVLSGTTNVAGSFPFSIKVTDSSTGVGAPFSATNSYTLAVAAPVLTLTPASLAAIRAGDAYSQTFTAGGGIAPYAYAVSGGALPTGLALDAATGILSGTPTVAGSFAFTLQAKDAHQFTVQQALTLLVNQAPPPVANETATTSANQEVSLTIDAIDGSPITAVTIVTPPSHGRVDIVSSARMARAVAAAASAVTRFIVTYTPNKDYFGPDSFSYTLTGPGGVSAPATFSLTVAPQPVPVPVAKTATVLAGTPVTLNVTEGATGGPFTAVAITTQPASGTAVVNGMDIVYTPGINTSGDISIGYTVSNAFGTSAPVKSTISVNPMPQVLSQSVTVVAGLTVTVDLTAGATGGPFTAANILSVAPAEAGKVLVRDVGTAGKPSYQLSFAASGKFAGAAVVSYTLSNAYATSKPGVVNVTVTARRDPSVDPEVIGLQAAQADAARRFASAQLSNFTQRLESLHGDGWGRSSFGLSLTPPNDSGNPTAALARWQADEADRVFGTAVKPFMRKAALRPSDAGFSSDARQQADVSGATSGLPDMPQKPDTQKQALSLWLGGAVDFGQHYVNGRETGFRFRTNGVSVGGDYRLSDLATVGVGAGFSHDRSDVGQNGSRSTADSAVAAVYGSLRPSKGVFLDGVLGYGTLQYDASRYLSDGSGFATGERDGKQVFGALVGGIEMRQETWMWSPYGRVELMSAKLDPYTEKAAGINALSYFKQTVRSRIGALGVRAEGIYVGGLGTWFPRARLEYRHQFQGADDARLAYADLAADGPVYVIRTVPQQTGNWAAGLGVKLLLSNGMTITVDYNSNLSMESGRTQSVMFGIAMPLR